MNQLITIMYQPGAYGSFIAWATERFSEVRKRHQPAVPDNPLLPDGSSHAYASFCKINNFADFKSGMVEARQNETPWNSAIYAGWPNREINLAVAETLQLMNAADRLIVVECRSEDDHALRYLRNEATLDQDRWYGMLGITSDNELVDAFRRDINTPQLNRYNQKIENDPRFLRLSFYYILESTAGTTFKELCKAWNWPTCDHQIFHDVFTEMQSRQERYVNRVKELAKGGSAESPAEFAVRQVLFKERN